MKRLSIILIIISFVFLCLVGLGIYLYPQGKGHLSPLPVASPEAALHVQAQENSHTKNSDSLFLSSLFQTYKKAWQDLQIKIEIIQQALEENDKLRSQNAQLMIDLELAKFNKEAQKNLTQTQSQKIKLNGKTGSEVGQLLEGISYKIPSHLSAAQSYTLGVSYLKANENEKAAVIFTTLTSPHSDMEGISAYQIPQTFLAAGVAWYRLENFILAEYYFSEVLKASDQEPSLPYVAQARLWKALIANQFQKKIKTQYWLRELVDHHPHSVEASWVN